MSHSPPSSPLPPLPRQPPPQQSTIKRAVRRAGVTVANNARRRRRVNASLRPSAQPPNSPEPETDTSAPPFHVRSKSSPTVLSTFLPPSSSTSSNTQNNTATTSTSNEIQPAPTTSDAQTSSRKSIKSTLDIRNRLRSKRTSPEPGAPPPHRRRDDLRQTILLSFPEYDSSTVAALLKRYHGDCARVFAKLHEFRSDRSATPASASTSTTTKQNKTHDSNPSQGKSTTLRSPRWHRHSQQDASPRPGVANINQNPSISSPTLNRNTTISSSPRPESSQPIPIAQPSASNPALYQTASSSSLAAETSISSDTSSASSTATLQSAPSVQNFTVETDTISPKRSGKRRRSSLTAGKNSASVYAASLPSLGSAPDTKSGGSVASETQGTYSESAAEIKVRERVAVEREQVLNARRSVSSRPPRVVSQNDLRLQNCSTFRELQATVERLEQTLQQFEAESLARRRELMHKIEVSESERTALEQQREALMYELEESQKKQLKTEQYLDIMRTDLQQAINQNQSRFFVILRAGLHNFLYYILAYLVPILAFLIRCVRDGVIVLRRKIKARKS